MEQAIRSQWIFHEGATGFSPFQRWGNRLVRFLFLALRRGALAEDLESGRTRGLVGVSLGCSSSAPRVHRQGYESDIARNEEGHDPWEVRLLK